MVRVAVVVVMRLVAAALLTAAGMQLVMRLVWLWLEGKG